MRNVTAAALAVPVIALTYVTLLVRRSILARVVLAVGVGALIGIGAIGVSLPVPTTATPPSKPVPVTSVEFRTDLRVDQAPNAAILIEFSTPMDETSVTAHLDVAPPVPVALSWSEDATTLSVRPTGAWETSRFHTITVEPGALALTGRPLSIPVRAAFLTRPAVVAAVAATDLDGERAKIATGFEIEFDRPIDPATFVDAFEIDPPVAGTLEPVGRRTATSTWRFRPNAPLAADTEYTVTVPATVLDVDGAPIADPVILSVRTSSAPEVVRFRPLAGSKGVERGATLSVRFTEPMDPATTTAALKVTANDKPVAGKVSFAEGNTVLVFDPTASFDWSQTVAISVGAEAQSAAGVALKAATSASFTTEAKPVPKPTPKPTPKPVATSGGGSVGSGSWTAVESYYLNLMNCTRTGGTVTSSGSCSSPGGRNVAPLILDAGISSKVARPYAKLLATRNLCSHFIGGNPGDRLRAAGYTSYIWAENLGCRSGDPYAAVLGSHLYFQSERSWSPQGGHYVNMMNAKYDRAGIGVWVASGRVRLVVNFYHPR